MTMEEVVNNVLTSDNLPSVIVGIVVIAAVVIVLAVVLKLLGVKIVFKSKHFEIGESEKERAIIRQQSEWAHSYCMSLEYKVPKDPTYNGYVTKYILERCYDEIVSWIMFNHLTIRGDYIKVKQQRIKMLVDQLATNELYRSDDFHNFLDEGTKYVIENLIHIREMYGN